MKVLIFADGSLILVFDNNMLIELKQKTSMKSTDMSWEFSENRLQKNAVIPRTMFSCLHCARIRASRRISARELRGCFPRSCGGSWLNTLETLRRLSLAVVPAGVQLPVRATGAARLASRLFSGRGGGRPA